jgi:hypothetical protein
MLADICPAQTGRAGNLVQLPHQDCGYPRVPAALATVFVHRFQRVGHCLRIGVVAGLTFPGSVHGNDLKIEVDTALLVSEHDLRVDGH